MPPFSKVLVANRGEIAIRVFRTLRELEIGCVAVYSEPDRGCAHVRAADEAYLVGPGPAAESYLRGDVLVEVALRAGAGAIHPGYGFLAENAGFARMVEAAGLTWIGPPPAAMELMGTKTTARRAMRDAGVPIVPGAVDPVRSSEEVVALGAEIGYPLIIKAAAGGGGKGMEIVRAADEAERAFETATRQGEKYFADAAVYVERYIENPRHVEVQVLADAHGHVIHLGERDCTIQRRHQKLVEETPSPAVDGLLRARIGRIAVDAARAAGYRSAGTIEGLLTHEGEYFFMEMNTRIQVEHTVTEAVTGLDLVREQVLIAAGEPLSLGQDDVVLRGHAIECRINAEDVGKGFLPAPGRITAYREPAGPGVRVDAGIEAGDEVNGLYDPMIAKLIVHDVDRPRAIARMQRALAEFVIGGPPTLVGFHQALLEHPCFRAGDTCAGVVESQQLADRAQQLADQFSHETTTMTGPADGAATTVPRVVAVEVDGRAYDVRLHVTEPPWAALARRRRERGGSGVSGAANGSVVSPMQGTVLVLRPNSPLIFEGTCCTVGGVARTAAAIELSGEEAVELRRLVRLPSTPNQRALRARIVLRASEGASNTTIAKELGLSLPTVGLWRAQFLREGLEGLSDRPRSGRPRTIDDQTVQRVLAKTLERPPGGESHWSVRRLAKETGLAPSSVARIWKTHRLQPHRTRTFKYSRDPELVAKVIDIVGLYLSPPEGALVLCVDEKTQVQALNRTQPILPLRPGLPEGRTHDYKRNGTTNLYAALQIATGQVLTDCQPRHRSQEFLGFLRQIDRAYPDGELHIVLDNSSTHTTPEVNSWLARHPRVSFHFTPTGASWMNMIESWFSILTRQQVRRGSYDSVPELISAIKHFAANWNDRACPFVWTKTADEIIAKATKQQTTSGTEH